MPRKLVSANAFFVFYALIVLNIVVLCLSQQPILRKERKFHECEERALKEIDQPLCLTIDSPEVSTIAAKIVDCRLSIMGKSSLECYYSRWRSGFKCRDTVTDDLAKEVITTLLDIFEQCHTLRREFFHVEVTSLLDKLTFSARQTEDMHINVLAGKLPLKLLQRIKEIQQDGVSVETMVLKKADILMQKASGIRRSLSDLAIPSKINDGQWNKFSTRQDFFSAKMSSENFQNGERMCIDSLGLCFSPIHMDWLFSLTCTSLFLFMLRRMEGAEGSSISRLIGTGLFAIRAYASSQNYTTFLEQFFLETTVGYVLLTVMIWLAKLCGVRL